MRFAGKVAIITGGAGEIGKATATQLAGEGARVLLADVAAAESDGQRFVSELAARGHEAAFAVCDVSREADVEQAVAAAVKRWGRLDVMVANAGVRGRNEIVKHVSEATKGLRTPESRGMHFSGSPVIDVNGDKANVWCDFVIVHITPARLETTATGRYYNKLEKSGGRWRFSQRVSAQQGAVLPPGLVPVPGA